MTQKHLEFHHQAWLTMHCMAQPATSIGACKQRSNIKSMIVRVSCCHGVCLDSQFSTTFQKVCDAHHISCLCCISPRKVQGFTKMSCLCCILPRKAQGLPNELSVLRFTEKSTRHTKMSCLCCTLPRKVQGILR